MDQTAARRRGDDQRGRARVGVRSEAARVHARTRRSSSPAPQCDGPGLRRPAPLYRVGRHADRGLGTLDGLCRPVRTIGRHDHAAQRIRQASSSPALARPVSQSRDCMSAGTRTTARTYVSIPGQRTSVQNVGLLTSTPVGRSVRRDRPDACDFAGTTRSSKPGRTRTRPCPFRVGLHGDGHDWIALLLLRIS